MAEEKSNQNQSQNPIHESDWWKNQEGWDKRFLDQNIPWDLGKVSPILVGLERQAALLPGSSVFIPGCGYGWDARYFSKMGYKVSAIDWSVVALEELRQWCRKEALNMEMLRCNFFEVPDSWYGTFDVWVEHTFFTALNPSDWPAYVEMTLKLMKPKAHFLACFFVVEDPAISPISGEPVKNPPFFTTEEQILKLFEPHFEILKFEPSPQPPRGPFEWQAHFVRK